MDLIEREAYLSILHAEFDRVRKGEGHCVFVSGEAGIGKSVLLKKFRLELKNNGNIFQGSCDALFTPRPLAPLFDILLQIRKDLPEQQEVQADRATLFAGFLQTLADEKEISVIFFEDIHWADEATLDFIKFLARRITQLKCLFVVTYRDEEIHSRHPVRNLLGQLNPDSFTRIQLPPLSKGAVSNMAEVKGYKGEDVYSITEGNPFYVTEILASYSNGIPDNIKDSILSVFDRVNEKSKYLWQMLSILPTGLETGYLEKLEPAYAESIEYYLDYKILVLKDGHLSFKHELYRRTIETSLSPLLRVKLNKRVLELFLEDFEKKQEIERIVHHAKNANEYDLVVKYAPIAAKQAIAVGAHIEACKLFGSAIEYYQGSDKDKLVEWYEAYAYESFLTTHIREAIVYEGKALEIWKEKNNLEKAGNCLRFLSRLWWYEGNHKEAESYATQAVEMMQEQPLSRSKAMALSNMSQLKMLSGITDQALGWGDRALEIASQLDNEEALCHVQNNMGTIQVWKPSSRRRGIELLKQSLEIALKNGYHEHAARAYTNLASCGMDIKEYGFANDILGAGTHYCEERNLDSLIGCLVSCRSRLNLEQGNWKEARQIAERLIKDENLVPVAKIEALVVESKIKMRAGEPGALELLQKAQPKAFGILELEYMIPVISALLEFEWIYGETVVDEKSLNLTIEMVGEMGNMYKNSEFAYWVQKARNRKINLKEVYPGYQVDNKKTVAAAATLWLQLGCHYEQALVLFEGSDEDKRMAMNIVHELGAKAVFEKMKKEMRASGAKSIPRGIRKSTLSNPALLTERELDVLHLLREGIQNKEIAGRLYISTKTVDHHISSILFKLDVNSRVKAVHEATRSGILK